MDFYKLYPSIVEHYVAHNAITNMNTKISMKQKYVHNIKIELRSNHM